MFKRGTVYLDLSKNGQPREYFTLLWFSLIFSKRSSVSFVFSDNLLR